MAYQSIGLISAEVGFSWARQCSTSQPLICTSKATLAKSSYSQACRSHVFVSAPGEPVLKSSRMAAAREVLCDEETLPVSVFQAYCDAHLQAACNLRVCTFNDFRQTYRIEEHCRFLSAIELEALKEKVEGKRPGFGKVICVLATVPIRDAYFEKDLLPICKITGQTDGAVEDRLVVGSLDLNQTPKLPDEMSGSRPEGVEGQYRRGYLSNVCVAKAVRKNGVGTNLIKHARMLALSQGISDLYTHVAVENVSARRLYEKSGFVLEKEEKASEARLMGRPPRLLLWMDLSNSFKH
eukprot:c21734_g1_i1 orf=73-957(+)